MYFVVSRCRDKTFPGEVLVGDLPEKDDLKRLDSFHHTTTTTAATATNDAYLNQSSSSSSSSPSGGVVSEGKDAVDPNDKTNSSSSERVKERIVSGCTSRLFRIKEPCDGEENEDDVGFGVDEEGASSSRLVYIHNVMPSTTLHELVKLMDVHFEDWDILESATCLVDEERNIYSYCLGFTSTVHAEKFYGKCRQTHCGKAQNGRETHCGKAQNGREKFVPMFITSFELVAYNRKSMTMSAAKADPNMTFFELPGCPRCYDRLDDSVTSIYTFDLWAHVKCPVCDLMQAHKPPSPAPSPSPSPSPSPMKVRNFPLSASTPLSRQSSEEKVDPRLQVTCEPCERENKMVGDIVESLWVCLICCNVGCGRFRKCHAASHFQESYHRFSVKLRGGYVWDYVADDFVSHAFRGGDKARLALLEEEEFGFDVEYDEDEEPAGDTELSMIKLNSISQYYTDLLTNQLEKQYEFFERQKEDLQHKCNKDLEILIEKEANQSSELSKLAARREELSNAKAKLDRKIEKSKNVCSKTLDEVEFYKSVNRSLLMDQKKAKDSGNITTNSNTNHNKGNGNKALDLDSALEAATKKWNRILEDKNTRLAAVQKQATQVMQAIELFASKQQAKNQ